MIISGGVEVVEMPGDFKQATGRSYRKAMQLILHNDGYRVNFPMMQEARVADTKVRVLWVFAHNPRGDKEL
jgi:glutathione peroxidase-family protein